MVQDWDGPGKTLIWSPDIKMIRTKVVANQLKMYSAYFSVALCIYESSKIFCHMVFFMSIFWVKK